MIKTFEEFKEYLEANLPAMMKAREMDNLGECAKDEIEYRAVIKPLQKNNGLILNGVTLFSKNQDRGPIIYLESYYTDYKNGQPLCVIMDNILNTYEAAMEQISLDVPNILNYEDVKGKIFVKVINLKDNESLLKDCPYKEFLDLAVTFRILVDNDGCELASSLVTDKEFSSWNISVEELYDTAISNTMRIFPHKIGNVFELLLERFLSTCPEEFRDEVKENMLQDGPKANMYMLSNEINLNGAACMLYENVIQSFAESNNCDLYILPSSLHEVMIIPIDEDTDVKVLKETVINANVTSVSIEDKLSDNVYLFCRDTGKITIV